MVFVKGHSPLLVPDVDALREEVVLVVTPPREIELTKLRDVCCFEERNAGAWFARAT